MSLKPKYKYEIAADMGISTRTLARWLNGRYFEDLVKLNYTKQQKYLLPVQIEFLNRKLCIYEN